MVLGIVGKYCSGKSYLGRWITQQYDFCELDMDKMAHTILEEKRDEVVALFDSSILNSEGEIVRRKIGAIVFGDPEKLHALEEVIHPILLERLKREISDNPEKNYLINGVVLYKERFLLLCDSLLYVKSPLILRLIRGKRRDNLSWRRIFQVVQAQKKISLDIFSQKVDTHSVSSSLSLRGNRRRIDAIMKG